jgi:hypothetical protein
MQDGLEYCTACQCNRMLSGKQSQTGRNIAWIVRFPDEPVQLMLTLVGDGSQRLAPGARGHRMCCGPIPG